MLRKPKLEGNSCTICQSRKERQSRISDLSFHLKKLEKKSKQKLEISGQKIIENLVEISGLENKEAIKKINKTKTIFFEINNVNKYLARLIRKN